IGSAAEREAFLPGESLVDPGPEQFDLFRRERVALGRHALVLVGAAHAADQFALGALAGNDDLGLEDVLARVEREGSLVLAAGVTLGTARLEQWNDVVSEVDLLRRLRTAGIRQDSDRNEANPAAHESSPIVCDGIEAASSRVSHHGADATL